MLPTTHQPAPEFDLPATGDRHIALADLRGRNVVLYFYPRDSTPGCTQEGQAFRDCYDAFRKANTEILGISRDSLRKHENFSTKHDFPFPLLADTEEQVCNAYGVLKEKNMYGKTRIGIERSTFLIDANGVLRREWRRVKVSGHADEVLQAVRDLEHRIAPTRNPVMARRAFVLDTNVLMHDPAALFRFEEHDVFLPMVVLEELDAGKKGLSEVARNVRQVSRFLDELMGGQADSDIENGINLNSIAINGNGDTERPASGRLFFETHPPDAELPPMMPGNRADNSILLTALSLRTEWPEHEIRLVSKDINLRIKATVLGIDAEDYYNDQVLDDLDLLFTGHAGLPDDFWQAHGDSLESWQETSATWYRVESALTQDWHINQFLHFDGDNEPELAVRSIDGQTATLELADNYREHKQDVWGVHARNREQNFALNMLMDPEIDMVTLLGAAGTGKTLLALAAGLAQTLDEQRYREIIMTRATMPVGEDIGFLPGTEEEKMTPWMGALMDNLEVLTGNLEGSDWERAATNELLSNRIRIRSLNFMRGRTFLQRFIILDEAQNLTPKQMKTLITRAGPDSKIICMGNLGQIDTPYLTETTSGLTNVIDRFRGWRHAGHVTLARGERSRLADFATKVL